MQTISSAFTPEAASIEPPAQPLQLVESLPSPFPWFIRGRTIFDRNGYCIAELQGPSGIAAANAQLLQQLAEAKR